MVRSRNKSEISNYLQTTGYVARALDMVADEELVRSGFQGVHGCFSDRCAFQALTRLIEGPVRSLGDLQAAEAALQALVFYDSVGLIEPGLVAFNNNVGSIRRPATPAPKPFASDPLNDVVFDEVVISEHVVIDGDRVSQSSLGSVSGIIGRGFPKTVSSYLDDSAAVAASLSVYPNHHRAAAFFTEPHFQQFFASRSFSGLLYDTVKATVLERSTIVPGSTVEVRLPLLIWILLGRVNDRAEIPAEIVNLREEFAGTRRELSRLDTRMSAITRQAEREDTARYYVEAFEAVVAAARQSNIVYVRHVIYQIINFGNLSVVDKAVKLINPRWKPTNPRTLINRSVAAKHFSELLDLEVVSQMVRDLFHDSEVAVLEHEAAARA